MEIQPSRFQWNKFKDNLHFYTLIGALPCIAIIFITNVFIGPATLTPIPEGYQPKHWEYHRVTKQKFSFYTINSIICTAHIQLFFLFISNYSIQSVVLFPDIFIQRHNKNTKKHCMFYIARMRRNNFDF